ncbi:MAG: TonB-dependent receptor domain-containing protein, partial [Parvibaculales bacterium]
YRLRDDDKAGPLEAPLPSSFDSETLDSLEIGYRAVYPGMSYEATAFIMQKENYHFRDGDDRYVTDGETDHMGVELSLDWMLARDWSIATQLTYAQHEYGFDRAFSQNYQANPTEEINSGNMIDGAPETLANTRLRYKYNERTYLNFDWEHVGSYFMDASNSAEYDGHNIFAVTADYVLSGQSRLSLRIDNLFDEAYAKRADHWRNANRYFPGEGRRFMARLSHDF